MTIVLDNNRKGSISTYLKNNTCKNAEINIMSPVFTVYAFDEIYDVLRKTEKVRFLFNEPTFIRNLEQNKKEVREFQIQMKMRESQLSESPYEINLKNNLDQNQVAKACFDYISNNVEVKSVLTSNTVNASNFYVKQKENSYLIHGQTVAFSMDGLGYNKRPNFTFNTVTNDTETLNEFEYFFNDIWNNDDLVINVKETLLHHITNLYKENSPKLIYYLTLYHLFGEKLNSLDEMSKIKERTGINKTKIWNMLYNFQHDAVVGAIKKLELYNGCIIADSVGLGKTYEALAIIKYYELRNARVMVLAPKKLQANWVGFKQNSTLNPLVDDRFNYDVLYHTDLSRERGKSGEIDLSRLNWGNYDLVVIDESHNFRNNPAVSDRKTRYQKLMEDIIQAGVKTKVLMLSATPVNNGLSDLKNQIMFITENRDDAFKELVGIDSIENTLRIAQTKFNQWSSSVRNITNTESLQKSLEFDFYNLLNTVTIARSRKHIQKYYDINDIGEFPERLKPISIKADIDLKKRFPNLAEINRDLSSLHLAIYSPIQYLLPTRVAEYEEKYDQIVKGGSGRFKQSDRERNLVNLMRVNLLKRLESSVHSFALTVERILNQVNTTISKLENHQLGDYEYSQYDYEDDEIDELEELGNAVKVRIKDLDQIRYLEDLKEDRLILINLHDKAKAVRAQDDAKLDDLFKLIDQKVNNPINGSNKKVLIFTAFSDTAEYLYQHLEKTLHTKFGLYSGIVTGSGKVATNLPKIHHDFEEILTTFSPLSSQMVNLKNEIDILIATDCISEGQNLQDCDYLVNYDIHWNPVRIIQRFGRIDRLGSKNKQIQLVNFWPNMELDDYIRLESRVRQRMTMMDISATGEDDLLNPESKDLEYRASQLEQLQTEVLDIEDMSGGLSITDLTLDDYLMALDKYMKQNPGLLESYPTGVHSITFADEKIKDEALPGVIFCLRQTHFDESQKSMNSLYPYYLVYVSNDGEIVVKNTDPKKILDTLKVSCSPYSKPIDTLVAQFNQKTESGNNMSYYSSLFEKAAQDIKGVVEEKGINSLFTLGKTSINKESIKGLEDFELITFMVIE